MIEVFHYGPDAPTFSGAHKGNREDCSHPGCAWPREGDRAVGICVADGKERSGEIVDLDGYLPALSAGDGTQWLVKDLRKPERGTTWCPHGLKIMEPVPAEHLDNCQLPRPLCTLGKDDPFHQCEPTYCPACYPASREVTNWPCTPQCKEHWERAKEAEVEDYWEGVNQLIAQQYD